jgi:hypothetical protein
MAELVKLTNYAPAGAEGAPALPAPDNLLPVTALSPARLRLAAWVDDTLSIGLERAGLETGIVVFGLLEDDRYRAFSRKVGDRYFIGFTTGLFDMIAPMMASFASTPAFCDLFDIVSPDQSREPVAVTPDWFDPRKIVFPATGFQLAMSYALAGRALQILAAHELAHAVCGHIGLLELGLSPKQRRCLEWDADCYAINLMLQDCLNLPAENRMDALRGIYFAGSAVWQADDFFGQVSDWAGRYPPAAYRALTTGSLMHTWLEVWSERDPSAKIVVDEYTEASERISRLSLESFLQAGAMSASKIEDYLQATGETADAYLAELEATWRSIRDDLQGYALGRTGIASAEPRP